MITIDMSYSGPRICPILYGIIFEEISRAGDVRLSVELNETGIDGKFHPRRIPGNQFCGRREYDRRWESALLRFYLQTLGSWYYYS